MALNYFYPLYEVVRNPDRCIAYRACVKQCANGVHSFDETLGHLTVDESKCVNCHRCVDLPHKGAQGNKDRPYLS